MKTTYIQYFSDIFLSPKQGDGINLASSRFEEGDFESFKFLPMPFYESNPGSLFPARLEA